MRVVLNVFSGRPNPTWRLAPNQAREVINQVAGRAVRPHGSEPLVLGFRGLTVETEAEDGAWHAGLPLLFDVTKPAPPAVAPSPAPADAGIRMAEEYDTLNYLLETGRGKVFDEILDAVRGAPKSGAPVSQPAEAARTAVAHPSAGPATGPILDAPACNPWLTPMYPAFWNYWGVRWQNNCYNYATNNVTNTVAQPGRWSGNPYARFDCDAVALAALSDGCAASCVGIARVIALAIWPGVDFHWYRLHPGGFWAHKLGTSQMTNLDNRGRLIGNGLTPETCDRGPYTVFCGYFFAPLEMRVA